MKHKILKMSSLKFIHEGAYGVYYRIGKSKVGIKILEHGCSTKLEAKQSLSVAWSEYNNLVQAAKRTHMVPRPKGLAIVEEHDPHYGKQYHVGYMMTHIVTGKQIGRAHV